MICCALLLLLLGGVRAVALTLLPGRSRHERTPFPPAARRIVTADGAGPAGTTTPAAAPEPVARRATRAPRHPSLGTALAVAGTAWFVVGLVGMHVFGIGATSMGTSLPRDMAFHLSGPLLASAGLLLRAPARARRAGPGVPLPAGPTS